MRCNVTTPKLLASLWQLYKAQENATVNYSIIVAQCTLSTIEFSLKYGSNPSNRNRTDSELSCSIDVTEEHLYVNVFYNILWHGYYPALLTICVTVTVVMELSFRILNTQ